MKKKEQSGAGLATQLRESAPGAFGLTGAAALGGSEAEIYRAMRENVPILDAAIGKLVRLTGGFTVTCGDRAAERGLRQFLKTVPVGHAQYGLECFLQTYLDCMLTYGRAVGEMIVADGRLAAVCWGDVTRIHVRQGASALEMELCVCENGALRALPYQNLLLFSTWKPEPGNPYGVSLLRGMPDGRRELGAGGQCALRCGLPAEGGTERPCGSSRADGARMDGSDAGRALRVGA